MSHVSARTAEALRHMAQGSIQLEGTAAAAAVGAMIATLFAGSTLLTPLYVIYQQQFGFSRITLTLIYAIYVLGNLASLMWFGRLSDTFGRRATMLPAVGVTIAGALVFLFATGTPALYVGRVLTGLGVSVGAGTATAWLAELIPARDKSRATIAAVSANFVGIGLGAAVGGLLAQYAPWPVHLPFVLYIVVLLAIALLTTRTRETVARPHLDPGRLSLRPQLGVPRTIRGEFVAPAVGGFGAMALIGFYAALAPSVLATRLHESNHAIAGAMLLELGVIAAIILVLTPRLSSRAAMLWALALMIPAVLLIVAAQLTASMPLMLIATAACAVASGLGYRGTLQVVNEIAPPDRRAEVVSSYLLCCFCGNALPVIGIGVLTTITNASIASFAFAGLIVVFAAAALVFGARYTKSR
ncbi:MAG TPA: MFS transporter [Xanthobacteraceae bacterium]|nr:MFS transporter [Xanthobacteraceae bacterium]